MAIARDINTGAILRSASGGICTTCCSPPVICPGWVTTDVGFWDFIGGWKYGINFTGDLHKDLSSGLIVAQDETFIIFKLKSYLDSKYYLQVFRVEWLDEINRGFKGSPLDLEQGLADLAFISEGMYLGNGSAWLSLESGFRKVSWGNDGIFFEGDFHEYPVLGSYTYNPFYILQSGNLLCYAAGYGKWVEYNPETKEIVSTAKATVYFTYQRNSYFFRIVNISNVLTFERYEWSAASGFVLVDSISVSGKTFVALLRYSSTSLYLEEYNVGDGINYLTRRDIDSKVLAWEKPKSDCGFLSCNGTPSYRFCCTKLDTGISEEEVFTYLRIEDGGHHYIHSLKLDGYTAHEPLYVGQVDNVPTSGADYVVENIWHTPHALQKPDSTWSAWIGLLKCIGTGNFISTSVRICNNLPVYTNE